MDKVIKHKIDKEIIVDMMIEETIEVTYNTNIYIYIIFV